MSQIADGVLHSWTDGENVTGTNMNMNQELLRAAVNDNAVQVAAQAGRYDNTTIDQKINSAVGTATIAGGTAFPSPANDGQVFYRTDLKCVYFYSAVDQQWHIDPKTGAGVTVASDGTISLNAATTSTIGGIIVGDGLNISSGTISARDILWALHMGVGGV